MKISVVNEKEPFGLTVSAGTYSPSYETRSGSIVTFSDAWVGSKIYPKASIFPVQSGSGNPSPDNVRPITGFSSVDVSRCGKNFYNVDASTTGYYINASGVLTADTGSMYSDLIPVIQSSYVFSGHCGAVSGYTTNNKRVHGYDAFGNWIEQIVYSNVSENTDFSIPFTISNANIKYIRIGEWISDTKIQVEKGSAKTDYSPYNGITKTISLGSTIYGGILNVDSGVLTVEYVKKTISSFSGAWGAYTNRYCVYVALNDTDHEKTLIDANQMKCNMFTYTSNTRSSAPLYSYGGSDGASTTQTFTLPSTITSLAEANAWLSNLGTDLECTFKLATPTTIQLTGEEITALLGENNVWANSGDVEVTYRKGGA